MPLQEPLTLTGGTNCSVRANSVQNLIKFYNAVLCFIIKKEKRKKLGKHQAG